MNIPPGHELVIDFHDGRTIRMPRFGFPCWLTTDTTRGGEALTEDEVDRYLTPLLTDATHIGGGA